MRSRFNINNYSNLAQRSITALIGGLIVVFGSIYSDWTYFLIFAGILGFSQMEFYKLSGLDGMLPLKSFGTFLGLMIFTLTFMVEKERLPDKYLFLIFPLVSLAFFIKLYKKTDKKPGDKKGAAKRKPTAKPKANAPLASSDGLAPLKKRKP